MSFFVSLFNRTNADEDGQSISGPSGENSASQSTPPLHNDSKSKERPCSPNPLPDFSFEDPILAGLWNAVEEALCGDHPVRLICCVSFLCGYAVIMSLSAVSCILEDVYAQAERYTTAIFDLGGGVKRAPNIE